MGCCRAFISEPIERTTFCNSQHDDNLDTVFEKNKYWRCGIFCGLSHSSSPSKGWPQRTCNQEPHFYISGFWIGCTVALFVGSVLFIIYMSRIDWDKEVELVLITLNHDRYCCVATENEQKTFYPSICVVLLFCGFVLFPSICMVYQRWKWRRKINAYAMKCVAGAHLPNPWLFEPAKRPEDRGDYCLGCSFFP